MPQSEAPVESKMISAILAKSLSTFNSDERTWLLSSMELRSSISKPAAEKPKKDTYPLYGEVVAVTPKLLTIKGGKDKPDRKFDITADTKIVDGDKAATIADVKVGKKVGGNVKKSESGNPTLLKLNVGVSQEARPKKAEDTPKKK